MPGVSADLEVRSQQTRELPRWARLPGSAFPGEFFPHRKTPLYSEDLVSGHLLGLGFRWTHDWLLLSLYQEILKQGVAGWQSVPRFTRVTAPVLAAEAQRHEVASSLWLVACPQPMGASHPVHPPLWVSL